ncbi:MAG: hypothetical protein Q8O67_01005 [Deltaproteobacteria bacterium]|nr:hypothetical protein [Deltaproteobacteria bacterium]
MRRAVVVVVVVVVVALAGCARLVVIPPEQVPARNDKDWVIDDGAAPVPEPERPLAPLEPPPPLG